MPSASGTCRSSSSARRSGAPERTARRASGAPFVCRSVRLAAVDPALEKLDLRFGPRAVARHRSVRDAREDRVGVPADIVVGPQVEVGLHGLAVAFAEQRLDVGLAAAWL